MTTLTLEEKAGLILNSRPEDIHYIDDVLALEQEVDTGPYRALSMETRKKIKEKCNGYWSTG
jgi:hypothetical protein